MLALLLSCVVITDDDIASKVGEGSADCTSPSTFYADADGDTYGDVAAPLETCDEPPASYVADSTDCDDAEKTVNPAAAEVCNGVDDDCSGTVDDSATDATTWYGDADQDGVGDESTAAKSCEAPAGHVAEAGDCDDHDNDVGLAAVAYLDADGDGYGSDATAYDDCDGTGVTTGGDCDDTRSDIHPGAAEDSCTDATDYNCDGSTGYDDNDGDGVAACQDCDDGDAAVTTGNTYYADLDADGAGDDGSIAVSCTEPDGYAGTGGDCDDLDPARYPGAAELCDAIDNDCDSGTGDDDALGSNWHADADADGYGDPAASVTACEQPDGYLADSSDCDDTSAAYNPAATEDDCSDPADYNCDGSTGYDDNDGDGFAACEECDDTDAAAFPGASETCDGSDDDCDGEADESDAIDPSTWYADADGDGFGSASSTRDACDAPAGYTADDTDCDDDSASVNPSALEVCNDLDDDCDGDTDTGAADAPTWYADDDGDGYGDSGDSTESCEAPAGYVSADGDCDDADAAYNPAAPEDDCADAADYNCDGATGYADADGDGFAACEDCDDSSAAVNPSATENCSTAADDDCSSSTNDTGATGCTTFYADADADGYGTTASQCTCSATGSYTASNDDDCDDGDADTFPGATETVGNGDDEDCSGAETCYADADNDGYAASSGSTVSSTDTDCSDSGEGTSSDPSTDCDDADADTFPGAASNDSSTSCMNDDDGDNYGDSTVSGSTVAGTDCDDTRSSVRPGASETCTTSYDDDCDSSSSDIGASGCTTYYYDADGDGYGSTTSQCTCSASGDYDATVNTDCDDASSSDYPGAAETVGNEDDEDCDGGETCYDDDDDDGYLDTTGDTRASSDTDCSDSHEGASTDATTDCDDSDADSFPGAAASESATACMNDDDGDDYGDSTVSGTTTAGTDCDDEAAMTNEGEAEVCNDGIDNDCDGSAGACELAGGSVSAADAIFAGVTSLDLAGLAVAGGGDVNGDGFDDVLVGAPGRTNGYSYGGSAYLVLGGATPLSGSLSGAVEFIGEATGLSAGNAVALVGDVDGDGFDDFVIGDPNDGEGGANAGAAYLLFGASSPTMTYLSGSLDYTGVQANDSAATSVSGAGDVDGDGFADVVIGATGNDTSCADAGAAYVILGNASPVSASLSSVVGFTGADCGETAGQGVSGAGDVDGDGLDDILVGASSNDDAGSDAGAVYLVLGAFGVSGASLGGAVEFVGENDGDRLGVGVGSAGDYNGDGLGDMVVGAYGRSASAGAAYLILGTPIPAGGSVSSGIEFSGETMGDFAGWAVGGGGDLDGDGLSDLVVGAHGQDDGGSLAGAAYVVLGTNSPAAASLGEAAVFWGEASSDNAGRAVSSAGDVNGDGHDDLVVGAAYNDAAASSAGAAYLILGQGL